MSMHAFPRMPSPLSAEPSRPRALVSLTPLIDVVFILLVFFMLASNFLDWRVLEVASPSVGSVGASMEGALLVEVRADGKLRLGGRAVAAHALERHIADHVAERPDQRVLVRPEPGVPLQGAIDVLDRINRAGAANVSLVREQTP